MVDSGAERPASQEVESVRQGTADAGSTSGGQRQTTLKLPLVGVTITRPAVSTAPGGDGGTTGTQDTASARPHTFSPTRPAGVPWSRVAFYAGALGLGALEVVEWPVTLLVVAGTYVADRARTGGRNANPAPVRAANVPAPTATPVVASSGPQQTTGG